MPRWPNRSLLIRMAEHQIPDLQALLDTSQLVPREAMLYAYTRNAARGHWPGRTGSDRSLRGSKRTLSC